MRTLVIAMAATLALGACGSSSELSTTEACGEVREPVEVAMGEGDVAAAAAVLRDVAERGDADVERVFGDAADAADYIAENGNVKGAPEWATIAFTQLDDTCGSSPGD